MKTDTRHILVDDKGIYLSAAARASLCDYCSINVDCRIRSDKPRRRCELYVPALSFSVSAMKGLTGSFSTFRSSRIWGARAEAIMQTHQTMGLVNAETGYLISLVTLRGYEIGKAGDLIAKSATTNHLVIAADIADELAPFWLMRQIRNLAGSRYIKTPEQISTVIYVTNKQIEAASKKVQSG